MPSQESLFKFVGIVLVFSAFVYFNSNLLNLVIKYFLIVTEYKALLNIVYRISAIQIH